MIKKELKGLDLNVYYEKLNNGLEIFLVPFLNRKNYYIEYGVKYGAKINEFESSDGKRIKTPYGTAHFLEHKMFEQEDGVDPFTFASKTGTYSNASTNYECTRYYFEGNKAKIQIGLGKGKKIYDKRQDIARKDALRKIDKAMKGNF